jgi:hypothetical protein
MRQDTALEIWGNMSEEQKKDALDLYDRMEGDEPELMGLFPLLAAIVPAVKGAFRVGKKLVGLVKKPAPPPPPPPPPKPKIPPAALAIGGGLLLLLMLTRR